MQTTDVIVTWAEGPSDMYPDGNTDQETVYTAAGLAALLRNLEAKPQVRCIDLFTEAGHAGRAERNPDGKWTASLTVR